MVVAGHMEAVAGLEVVATGEEFQAALVPTGRPQRPGGTRSGHRILRFCGCDTQRQNARVTQKRRASNSGRAVPVL